MLDIWSTRQHFQQDQTVDILMKHTLVGVWSCTVKVQMSCRSSRIGNFVITSLGSIDFMYTLRILKWFRRLRVLKNIPYNLSESLGDMSCKYMVHLYVMTHHG